MQPALHPLRALRNTRKLTLQKLEAMAGVDASSIGNYETGRYDMSDESLKKIASALKVDASAITRAPQELLALRGPAPAEDQEKLQAMLARFTTDVLFDKAREVMEDKSLTLQERAQEAINFLERVVKRKEP